MKTTVEIPDALFRAAKAAAAGRGVWLKVFLNEALKEKLAAPARRRGGWPVPPPPLAEGTSDRVREVIEQEFSRIDPDDWRRSWICTSPRRR